MAVLYDTSQDDDLNINSTCLKVLQDNTMNNPLTVSVVAFFLTSPVPVSGAVVLLTAILVCPLQQQPIMFYGNLRMCRFFSHLDEKQLVSSVWDCEVLSVINSPYVM